MRDIFSFLFLTFFIEYSFPAYSNERCNKQLKLLVAEVSPIIRLGLRSVLAKHRKIVIIDEVQDGYETIQLVGKYRPDVILMDNSLTGINGTETTHHILKEFPSM